jgi:hypothetical protein
VRPRTPALTPLCACAGLIAWSFFNDSISMSRANGGALSIKMEAGRESDIAWATDIDKKFKNAADGSTGLNFPPFAHAKAQPCSALPTPAEVTGHLLPLMGMASS